MQTAVSGNVQIKQEEGTSSAGKESTLTTTETVIIKDCKHPFLQLTVFKSGETSQQEGTSWVEKDNSTTPAETVILEERWNTIRQQTLVTVQQEIDCGKLDDITANDKETADRLPFGVGKIKSKKDDEIRYTSRIDFYSKRLVGTFKSIAHAARASELAKVLVKKEKKQDYFIKKDFKKLAVSKKESIVCS